MTHDQAPGPEHGLHHVLLQRIQVDDVGLPLASAFVVRLYWPDAILLRGPFGTRDAAQEWIEQNEPRINGGQPSAGRALITIHPLDDGSLIDAAIAP